MDDQTKRVFLIMKEKNMNATQFSKAIGINSAIISQIKGGRNKVSGKVLTKIINYFTDINPDWLMTGKGSMKIDSEQQQGLFESNSDLFNTIGKTIQNQTNALPKVAIGAEIQHPVENHLEDTVNQPKDSDKIVEKEVIIYKEKPVKIIEKLVIFYSDRTYETFVPDKGL